MTTITSQQNTFRIPIITLLLVFPMFLFGCESSKDTDGDKIVNAEDNCPNIPNSLQVDFDDDGVGDVCDNCPAEPNPNQEDSNNDGGGDACQPSPLFAHCGTPFTPDEGIARELFDDNLPHPKAERTVHPVIQFSSALMDGHLDQLNQNNVKLNGSFSHSVYFASLKQQNLEKVSALPFVRAMFPYPMQCRIGSDLACPLFEHGHWDDKTPSTVSSQVSSPTERTGLAISYDAKRNVSVLFGGKPGPKAGGLNDTWLWNGMTWTQAGREGQPPGRSNHAMAFDAKHGVTVLFGGLTDDPKGGPPVASDDTWTWGGTNWNKVQVSRPPSTRSGHAMAFDKARNVVWLFGGADKNGDLLADTWSWDGGKWVKHRPANSPAARQGHAIAYDTARNEIVLFGGRTKKGAQNDTWVWDGSDWTPRKPDRKPSARAFHAMDTKDPACGVILFGGASIDRKGSDETWYWDGESWILIHVNTTPQPRSGHGLAYDRDRGAWVAFGGQLGSSLVTPLTFELEPSSIMEVVFHDDTPQAVADDILTSNGAIVLNEGVTIGSRTFNTWHVATPKSKLNALISNDPVVHAQFVPRAVDTNDGSSLAMGVNLVQAAPFCGGAGCTGNNIVFAQWETRWASGDATPPPPQPPLPGAAVVPGGDGIHDALTGRITVRDLPTPPALNPVAPAGCAGNIVCNRCTFSNHAAHVAGTLLGDGTGNAVMTGMAPAATNISYNLPGSVAELACELTDSNQTFGARLANNSWGNGSNNATMAQYDAFSQGYDNQVQGTPAEAVMFAAGNKQRCRFQTVASGNCGIGAALPAIYSGPSAGGGATCTASPAGVVIPAVAEPAAVVRDRFFTVSPGGGPSAKNTLVVGAINSGSPSAAASFGRMTTFSSWGPTQDGRIKPDLVAAGAEDNQRDGTAGDPDPQITSTNCTAVAANGDCTTIDNGYGALRGTSMATPSLTGGAALVLQQQAISGLVAGDVVLDSDSLKALLVHTATDLQAHFGAANNFMTLQNCSGNPGAQDCWPIPAIAPGTVQDGPDYVNGWGLVNIQAATQKVIDGNPQATIRPSGCPNDRDYTQLPFNSPLSIGGDPSSIGIAGCSTASIWDWVGYITVPAGTTQLKITIAWDDTPSAPPAAGATADLINSDLDLVVVPVSGIGGGATGPYNYSWWLDPACPYRPAARVTANTFSPATFADHRNNVEQVIVDNPAAGTWKVIVNSPGTAAAGIPQPFSIMISMPPSLL